MGVTISITNQKGGVGKTITATCLAALLTEQGYHVLTISLDPQRNLDMAAGPGVAIKRADAESLSMLHVLKGVCTMEEATVKTQYLGDLVRASSQLYQWTGEQMFSREEYLAVRDNHEELVKLVDSRINMGSDRMAVLKKLIVPVKDKYDFLLIDTNPSLTLLTLNSIFASDGIIIPAFSEKPSVEAIIELWDTVNSIQYFNAAAKIRILGILMTKCNMRSLFYKRHVVIYRKLAAKIGTRLFDTKIRQSARAVDYVDAGVDLVHYDPKGNTTLDYRQFTKELLRTLREEGLT